MKTIFIIILVTLAGFLFGLLLVKIFITLSTWLLSLKTREKILKEDKLFFYKKQPYSLKEEIEKELSKRTTLFKKIKNLFKKKVKGGISEYGRTDDTGFKREQVSTSGEGIKPSTEQPNTDTAQPNGEQRSINSDLP